MSRRPLRLPRIIHLFLPLLNAALAVLPGLGLLLAKAQASSLRVRLRPSDIATIRPVLPDRLREGGAAWPAAIC